MAHQLSGQIKVVPAVIPTAGAAASITPVEVNAIGYDRALFIIATGAANTGATINAKVQESATSGGSLADHAAATDITELAAATGTSKVVTIDMAINPAKPYLKITGTVGTETFANSCVCILYHGSRSYPATATAWAESVVVN